jgi:hypothetical protein
MHDDTGMRTTLDIEEDVLLAVKKLATQEGTTAGKVVSRLVREALQQTRTSETVNGVPLFPTKPGAAVVTLELVNRLRDEAP